MTEPSGIRTRGEYGSQAEGERLGEPGPGAVELGAWIAARHFGAIASWQMQAHAITRSRIQSWTDSGRLHPRYPGVFAWGRPDLPVEGELATGLLYARHGAALTGLSDLWWRGLLNRRPDRIHIDAPGYASSRDDLRIRHPREVERTWHRDLPVVPLALALAAEDLSLNSLRLVLARAEYEGQLSLRDLDSELRRGMKGAGKVRAAMAAHLPQLARCVNRYEREFVLLCERSAIPLPDPNEPIGRFRPDMLWRSAMVVVELNGDSAHTTSAQRNRDAAKRRHLRSLGHRVLSFRNYELSEHPDRVMAEVAAALP